MRRPRRPQAKPVFLARYALAHKGVPVEFRLVRFADVETIRALSGQHMVPILCGGDRVIHDSWNIACYLEDRVPDRPSLFGGEDGRGLARLVNNWAAETFGPVVRRLISADFILCLAPEYREYFRRSREAAVGCTLEEYCADRPRWLAKFGAVTAPLEAALREQPYSGGATATYADWVLFSMFQFAGLGCSDDFVAEGTALRPGATSWRGRLTGWATVFRGIRQASPDTRGRRKSATPA